MAKAKYKYIVDVDTKKVICLSSYGGKTVRGIAKCNDTDTFDETVCKQLAKLRCDAKIALMRAMHASNQYAAALSAAAIANARVQKMRQFSEDAALSLAATRSALAQFESRI